MRRWCAQNGLQAPWDLLSDATWIGGFSEKEIAEALGMTERTVRRDWSKAPLLLRAMLSGNTD